MLIGAACKIVKQLHKPLDSGRGHDDSGPFTVLTLFRNLEVAAARIFLEIQVEQLALDLQCTKETLMPNHTVAHAMRLCREAAAVTGIVPGAYPQSL